MKGTPRYKLISLLPSAIQAVATHSTLIETVYHQKFTYELEFMDASYVGDPIERVFTTTYLDELTEHEDDRQLGEQIDFLAWHITPVFAEQLAWLYADGWTRGINVPKVEEWFQPEKRYVVLVQAINKRGEPHASKLAWLRNSDETEALEQLLDTAHCLEGKDAGMFAYTVYEPQLVAAFSLFRRHAAWRAPELVEDAMSIPRGRKTQRSVTPQSVEPGPLPQ